MSRIFSIVCLFVLFISCREEIDCESVVDYVLTNETDYSITLPLEPPVTVASGSSYTFHGESLGPCDKAEVKFEAPLTAGVILFNEDEFCWNINPNNDLSEAEGPARIQNYQFSKIGRGHLQFEYVFLVEDLEHATSCE